jgi:predicted RNA-binding protein YlqC (UPF0109 family)
MTNNKDITKVEDETEVEDEIIDWIKLTTKKIVTYPDEIEIEVKKKAKSKGRTLIVIIRCNDVDNGKIIGKEGSVINAIRRLVMSMLGTINKRVSILVID